MLFANPECGLATSLKYSRNGERATFTHSLSGASMDQRPESTGQMFLALLYSILSLRF